MITRSPETLQSEIDYLRALKEADQKTIQRQLTMLQNRNAVIEEKDNALTEILVIASNLEAPKVWLVDTAQSGRAIRQAATKALEVGIKMAKS